MNGEDLDKSLYSWRVFRCVWFFFLAPRCKRYYPYLQDLLHLQPLKIVATMLYIFSVFYYWWGESISVCVTLRGQALLLLRAPTHILFIDFYLLFLCLHRFLALPLNNWYAKSLSSINSLVVVYFFFFLLVPVITEPGLKLFNLIGLYEMFHWSSA